MKKYQAGRGEMQAGGCRKQHCGLEIFAMRSNFRYDSEYGTKGIALQLIDSNCYLKTLRFWQKFRLTSLELMLL